MDCAYERRNECFYIYIQDHMLMMCMGPKIVCDQSSSNCIGNKLLQSSYFVSLCSQHMNHASKSMYRQLDCLHCSSI